MYVLFCLLFRARDKVFCFVCLFVLVISLLFVSECSHFHWPLLNHNLPSYLDEGLCCTSESSIKLKKKSLGDSHSVVYGLGMLISCFQRDSLDDSNVQLRLWSTAHSRSRGECEAGEFFSHSLLWRLSSVCFPVASAEWTVRPAPTSYTSHSEVLLPR